MNISCPHFDLCSGCSLNKNVEQLPLIFEARAFFKEQGVPEIPFRTGSACGWRCRAKLAVRGSIEKPIIGLFKEKSHEALDIPNCQVHHPAINRAAAILRTWIQENNIEPYEEKTGLGSLRYVQMTVERATSKVQLVLVFNQTKEKEIENLWEDHKDLWHSIWINQNKRRDNIIFGEQWKLVYGQEWLWDTFCGERVCFHPASFYQANPEMFEKLLQKIKSTVPQGTSVVEFYSGSGVIGLTLTKQVKSVSCVEVVPLAEVCFKETYRQLNQSEKEKLLFFKGTSKAHKNLLKPPTTVVVVDPPRKGLEPELLETLCVSKNLEMIVYVSCGWKSFTKDCENLLKSGWKIKEAEAFLFFPGSEHLEILAIFVR